MKTDTPNKPAWTMHRAANLFLSALLAGGMAQA